MCVPVLAIQAGLAIASAYATYAAQKSAADATTASVKQQDALQHMDLARQADQQHEAEAQQVNEHARAAMRDSALFDTVAGEFGGGNSVDRGRAASGIQHDEQLATIGRNANLAAQENSMSNLALTSQTNARLASIQQPSKVGAALKIGGALASSYSQYSQGS